MFGVLQLTEIGLPDEPTLISVDGIGSCPEQGAAGNGAAKFARGDSQPPRHVGLEQPERVIVVEDERATVDLRDTTVLAESMGLDVPRCQAGARMLDDVHPFEPNRPVIEILLIAHLPILGTLVAPLDTSVMPPVQRLEAVRVTTERDPLHVIGAIHRLGVTMLRSVSVRDDCSCRVPDLGEDRSGIRKEPEVGIQIGDAFDRRIGRKDVEAGDGRCGPAVLDGVSVRFHSEECGIEALQSVQRHDLDIRELEAPEHRCGVVVHAEHPEPK